MQKELSFYSLSLLMTTVLVSAAASSAIVHWMIEQGFLSNSNLTLGIAGAHGTVIAAWLWDELRKISLPFTAYLSVLVFAVLCFAGLMAARHT